MLELPLIVPLGLLDHHARLAVLGHMRPLITQDASPALLALSIPDRPLPRAVFVHLALPILIPRAPDRNPLAPLVLLMTNVPLVLPLPWLRLSLHFLQIQTPRHHHPVKARLYPLAISISLPFSCCVLWVPLFAWGFKNDFVTVLQKWLAFCVHLGGCSGLMTARD